jgi:hypothetical protein
MPETTRFLCGWLNASQSIPLSLPPTLTVGAIATYLTRLDPFVHTRTLEIATPLHPKQRLRDTDLQTGDKLLLQTHLPKPLIIQHSNQNMPNVRVMQGDFQMSSQGKTSLILGAQNAIDNAILDVDLRYFVAPMYHEWLASQCLWLHYDPAQTRWYATKMGQTRLFLNEYELISEKVPLDKSAVLRLYPPHNAFLPANRLLAEISIVIEPATSQQTTPQLPVGATPVRVHMGIERHSDIFNASDLIRIEDITTAIQQKYQLSPQHTPQAYLLKLLSPQTSIAQLALTDDDFLYAPRNLNYVQSTLRLWDMNNRQRMFELLGGQNDTPKRIGCRAQSHAQDPVLDVDLYEMFVANTQYLKQTHYLGLLWGTVVFHADENTWWLHAQDRPMPLFVNNRRVGKTPIKLMPNDVVSVGIEASDVVLRLGVDIGTNT